MLGGYREELICDLAETYGIYDYKALPVETLAVLASGLRDDSRVRQQMGGLKVSPDTLLLAKIYDVTNYLLWAQTEDGAKGRNAPEPISNKFLIDDESTKSEYIGFRSGAEFDAAREAILKKVGK